MGREIVRQLVASGRYAVHSLDLFIPPKEKQIAGVTSFIQADITSKEDVLKALEGIDVIFHVAGVLPYSVRCTAQVMERVNLEGTKNIVTACRECGVKRLVFASSCSVILSKDSRGSRERIDEFFPLPKIPLNAYVRTKGLAEMVVREANDANGLRTCALRLGSIVGGKDSYTTRALMRSSVITLGKGDYVLPWVTLESAAKVHLLAEQHLEKRTLNVKTNVFNVISDNIKYKYLCSFFSLENTGKDAVVVNMLLCKLLASINETVFLVTDWAPLGEKVVRMGLDFLIPFSLSTEYTEKELGWVEEEPWQVIMRKVIADYKATE